MTYCKSDCCGECPQREKCGGCEACGGRPLGGRCAAAEPVLAGADFDTVQAELVAEINSLGITGLHVDGMNLLPGSYLNLEYTLPDGTRAKLLRDADVYFANQIEREGERCYGIAADADYILVCEYGCNGSDPEIIDFRRRHK